MMDLLKKMENWNWTPQCQESFDRLKRAMVTDPVSALSDMSKPFVVETDASDFTLGGVLMQDGHPVAFESRKLKDVERRYSVHEKALLAVVHCLRLWRHYLLGSPFVVKMDNTTGSGARVTIEGFSSAGPGPPRRAGQSLATLAGRRPSDDQGKPLVCAKGRGPKEVTHFGMPRHSLDQGEERTYALVQRAYYWPQMRDDIKTYVHTCLICQQDKEDHQKKAGLLQPLPLPTRPWESVSMDYISGLPKVGDLGSIIVVVDRLSKYATFITVPKHVTAQGTAHLFFKHIVRYWGLPKDIVSDRDSRFTGVF
ncbi:UNVERIFIED_CONTAM: Transposon Tf2-11 polyprotein [Sesamum latifolium]|uniref:Transposon Tf2-11 polyprotein n=1 Tax=Sesamum latifolium TaxID=2727402 RepID=A0AAW2YB07_9LAMI